MSRKVIVCYFHVTKSKLFKSLRTEVFLYSAWGSALLNLCLWFWQATKKNNKIDINTKCASLFFYKQTVTILCSLKGFQKRITKWNIRLNDFKYLATSYLSHSKNKPIEQQKHTCQTNRETMFIWIICSLPTNFSKI